MGLIKVAAGHFVVVPASALVIAQTVHAAHVPDISHFQVPEHPGVPAQPQPPPFLRAPVGAGVRPGTAGGHGRRLVLGPQGHVELLKPRILAIPVQMHVAGTGSVALRPESGQGGHAARRSVPGGKTFRATRKADGAAKTGGIEKRGQGHDSPPYPFRNPPEPFSGQKIATQQHTGKRKNAAFIFAPPDACP